MVSVLETEDLHPHRPGAGRDTRDLRSGSERRPARGGRDTDGAPVGPLRLPCWDSG